MLWVMGGEQKNPMGMGNGLTYLWVLGIQYVLKFYGLWVKKVHRNNKIENFRRYLNEQKSSQFSSISLYYKTIHIHLGFVGSYTQIYLLRLHSPSATLTIKSIEQLKSDIYQI